MKGYNTSKDYSLLWKLIQEGYRVPAWLTYDNFHIKGDKITDLVEVKIDKIGEYRIGVRGIGIEGFEQNESDFSKTCAFYDLKFILPTDV